MLTIYFWIYINVIELEKIKKTMRYIWLEFNSQYRNIYMINGILLNTVDKN